MVKLKCQNCAGEMSVDLKGELYCPFCGAKSHFSDIESEEYKKYRMSVLQYLRAGADEKANEADGTFLWNYHDTVSFTSADGRPISIDYLFSSENDGVKSYVAKDSVILIFKASDINKAEQIAHGTGKLDYPSADLKNLGKYFPIIKSRIDLDDGGLLLAIDKPENAYPLYAFGPLRPEHVAWVVSRMENFCCVFEFSQVTHGGISIDSVYINPRTHEAYLLGGWWNLETKRNSDSQKDLRDLRKVAEQLLGEYINDAPKEFVAFINSIPKEDAYTDFGKWDEVIEKGFGGHKFTKFAK